MSLISDAAPKKVVLQALSILGQDRTMQISNMLSQNTRNAVASVKEKLMKPMSVLANEIGANAD